MRNLIQVVFLSSTLLVANSCKKEKKEGCTNHLAENYNTEAQKDDGSCAYKGSLAIWFDSAKASDYSATASDTLNYYLNDEFIGTLNILDFLTKTPTCGDNQTITIQRDLGGLESKSYSLTVKNTSNTVLDTYTAIIHGGTCTSFLLK